MDNACVYPDLVQESILSSAWCGGKSRLEQMVERQQATLRALMSTHTEKMARLKQNNNLYVFASTPYELQGWSG